MLPVVRFRVVRDHGNVAHANPPEPQPTKTGTS